VVEMTVMKIVDMTIVSHTRMTASGSVSVLMSLVCDAGGRHKVPF